MKHATMYWRVLVGILLLGLNSPPADGLKWGNDILIWEGDISCFDVDYTMDGTMYLAFQEDVAPDYPVNFYTSSDHGYTWDYRAAFPMPGRISKMKLIAGEPVHNYLYFFFVDPSNGRLLVVKINRNDFTVLGDYPVSPGLVVEEGFDVTRSIEDNYVLYAVFIEDGTTSYHSSYSVYSSSDYGETWVSELGDWGWNLDSHISIAWGPPSNLYVAYAEHWADVQVDDSLEVVIRPIFLATGHSYSTRVTFNSHKDYDPHVAASNDLNNPAIWIVYTHDYQGTGDLDLWAASVPSPDSIPLGQEWNMTPISTTNANEYWGDIEFYKASGNRWVDMVYIVDVVGVHRYAMWTYSSGANPTSWASPDTINDNDAHPWPYGAAPRIAYSPGAPTPGSGVVYAGVGSHNSYFDGRWFTTGVEESTSPEYSHFSVYPNLLTAKAPLKVALSKQGLVELSLYDLSGSLTYHLGPIFWNRGSHFLPLNQLRNGVYFLELKLNGRLSNKTKLVILR